jgi:hypothetical protein
MRPGVADQLLAAQCCRGAADRIYPLSRQCRAGIARAENRTHVTATSCLTSFAPDIGLIVAVCRAAQRANGSRLGAMNTFAPESKSQVLAQTRSG